MRSKLNSFETLQFRMQRCEKSDYITLIFTSPHLHCKLQLQVQFLYELFPNIVLQFPSCKKKLRRVTEPKIGYRYNDKWNGGDLHFGGHLNETDTHTASIDLQAGIHE